MSGRARLGTGAAQLSSIIRETDGSHSAPTFAAQDLPLDLPAHVSLRRQLRAAERELALRKRVYPTRIACRRMSRAKAADELAAMAAIVDTLAGLLGEAAP
jgi:hypothetical protein